MISDKNRRKYLLQPGFFVNFADDLWHILEKSLKKMQLAMI